MTPLQTHRPFWLAARIVAVAILCVCFRGPQKPMPAIAQGVLGRPTIDQFPYPRVWSNDGMNSIGWPLVGSTDQNGTCVAGGAACAFDSDCGGSTCNNPTHTPAFDAPLNQATIHAIARYPVNFLPPTPVTDTRPDILAALKAANPGAFYVGYTHGGATWCPRDANNNNSYPAGSYYHDYYLAVTGGDPSCDTTTNRLLWLQNGKLDDRDSSVNINLAYHVTDGSGHDTYPVADDVAQAIFNHTVANHQFDATMLDVFCDDFSWMETSGYVYDYQRAGYGSDNTDPANRAAFFAGWRAGHVELERKLRALATAAGQPTYPFIGNCGAGTSLDYPNFNGWMREGFPFQDGGSWVTNMFGNPGGLLHEDRRFQSPQLNLVVAYQTPYLQPYSAFNLQKLRFSLASATLGSGAMLFFNASGSPYTAPDYTEWYDEYAVNTSVPQSSSLYGQSDTTHTGWLGLPKGDYYQMIAPNANPDLTSGGDFESGLGSWTFSAYNGQGSSDMTSGDAPQGQHALHTSVTQLLNNADGSPASWASQVTSSPVSFTANTNYSVTFWAKADRDRDITANLELAGSNSLPGHAIPLTTDWKQFQITVKTSVNVSDRVRIYLGSATGEVWLDDLHVRVGTGNVYRRDFDHGIVLLNGEENSQTVTLEKPYRKIHGSVAPAVNDGSVVSTVTLAGTAAGGGVGDALFLLNYDGTAPAKVSDLSAQ